MKMKHFIGLFLLALVCAVPIFAQENLTKQCEDINEPNFAGTRTSFSFVKTDLRAVLNHVTDLFSCSFTIDKSVGQISVTASFHDVPWNVALKNILQSHGLNSMVYEDTAVETGIKRKLILVATEQEVICRTACCLTLPKETDLGPVRKEFVQIVNLPSCFENGKCEQVPRAWEKLVGLLSRRLSKKGSIEAIESTRTLIITDYEANVEALKKLVELIDISEFYNEPEENKQEDN